jgi:hypothetical protein
LNSIEIGELGSYKIIYSFGIPSRFTRRDKGLRLESFLTFGDPKPANEGQLKADQ